MRPPRISVVIPTRDRADLVGRAIASVRAQTVSDWELIVVDDASSDGTPEYLAGLARQEPRLVSIRNGAPAGAAAARNLAIGRARGEWIALLDDDDEWLPTKLERQLAALGPGVGLTHTAYRYIRLDGTGEVAGRGCGGVDAFRALLRGNFIGNSTVVARREAVLAAGGFDERLGALEDYDLWLRVCTRTELASVDEPLARIYQTASSVTYRGKEVVEAASAIIGKHEGARTRAELADLCCSLGHQLAGTGLGREGRRLVRRGVATCPWPPRRLVMGAAAALGQRPFDVLVAAHARLHGRAG